MVSDEEEVINEANSENYEFKFEKSMSTFHEQNESRYLKQAIRLLRDGLLVVTLGEYLLRYEIESHGCTTKLSVDGGRHFRNLGWCRLEPDDGQDTSRLTWEFAQSETQALLEG